MSPDLHTRKYGKSRINEALHWLDFLLLILAFSLHQQNNMLRLMLFKDLQIHDFPTSCSINIGQKAAKTWDSRIVTYLKPH